MLTHNELLMHFMYHLLGLRPMTKYESLVCAHSVQVNIVTHSHRAEGKISIYKDDAWFGDMMMMVQ